MSKSKIINNNYYKLYIELSNNIVTSFIKVDNQNIMNKLKNLVYIYKKTHKRIKLIYFLKYKNQIELIKYKSESFISNNNNVHERLYNDLKTKRDNIDKLSQKIFQEEAKKYTYFPEINHYDLIYNNYYIINNVPDIDNRSEKTYSIKTEISNSIKRNNKSYQKKPSHEMNIRCKTLNDNHNIINPKNKTFRENNIKNKKIYFNSIIKKNLSLLNELEGEEAKIKNNRVTSKIVHYKNTIPNNYKNNNPKIIKNSKTKKIKIHQNKEPKRHNLNNNKNQRTTAKNYDLTSFYSSPITINKINSIINKKSNYNSEIINNGKSKSHSYYAQSTQNNTIKNTKSINKNRIILSPNTNHNNNNILKKGLTTLEIKDNYNKKNKKANSYKFIPKNECSLVFEVKKNKSHLKSNNYDNKKLNISKNRYNCITSNNYRQLNSIGLIDNSISTNFVDRPSINDNFTLSGNDINQQSLIYNKANTKISYTFPSKGNNNISIYNKDLKNNNISLKKTNTKQVGKKNHKKIFNRIIIDRNLGNMTSYTINTDSSSKNPKTNNNDNYKEQFINFYFLNELMDKKPKNNNLIITSGEVNENVNQERNRHEKANSISQKSDTITMQSMSDSKIMEIANYYLHEEEAVDKIKIGDILTTKNNKSNYNIK